MKSTVPTNISVLVEMGQCDLNSIELARRDLWSFNRQSEGQDHNSNLITHNGAIEKP